jgi:hypothetical protein
LLAAVAALTLAQDVLARMGTYIFTDAPSIAEERAGRPHETPLPDELVTAPGRLTVERASERVGFSVLVPTYLPAGYEEVGRNVAQDDQVSQVITWFSRHAYSGIPDFFDLAQQRWLIERSLTWAIGEAEPQTVNVGGVEGLYNPDAPIGLRVSDDLPSEGITLNMLIWEEEDFTFMVRNQTLEFDELLAIAESLQ